MMTKDRRKYILTYPAYGTTGTYRHLPARRTSSHAIHCTFAPMERTDMGPARYGPARSTGCLHHGILRKVRRSPGTDRTGLSEALQDCRKGRGWGLSIA